MREKHDQQHLDALRERLYSRGNPPEKTERVKLSDEKKEVPTTWNETASKQKRLNTETRGESSSPASAFAMKLNKGKYSYRVKIMLTALAFFVAAVLLSSLFILFGGNSISGENIAVSVNGPFTVGGGEELPLQIGITNQNSVAIESATLIVEYPRGTQSTEEEGRELFIDRIALDAIRSGETVNVPLRAKVFGEENEELLVHASVEYRVAGSNATFFKEAEPLRFKISSSPVSIEVDSIDALASGQETEVKLIVRSNASTPLSDILVKAEYPAGFDFTSSTPNPVSGQNTWSIDLLEPEESVTISLKGIVRGQETDERTMHFSVGVANERDHLNLASVFSTASAEFTIEQPFLDVSVSVDGSEDGILAVEPDRQSNIQVKITNSLNDTIYNGAVEVVLSGNALSDIDVHAPNGFYDSNTKTVVWDTSSMPRLSELAPGASETFRFVVTPDTDTLRTPQINLEVSVRARRVRESRASESLVGSAKASIKVASNVGLDAETKSSNGGPVPPVVGEATIYTLQVEATGGSNDATGGTVTATLPSYVTWLDSASGEGSISYNSSDRSITWRIGDIDANDTVNANFQVSLLPSTSQIGTTPTLMTEQYLRAEDRFTGTVIRASNSAITAQVTGSSNQSGEVMASE